MKHVAVDRLTGLTLAQAFRAVVLEDGEVLELGRCLMEARPSRSTIFVEGQFPGPMVDFHWPLHASAETIAWGFVNRLIFNLSEPLPEPSELESQAAKILANRMQELVNVLSSGEIVGIGTFSMTGIEAPIGGGQWRRQDLAIDVKNSGLCECREHRQVALWTGVHLQLAESAKQPGFLQPLPQVPKSARTQIQTKNNCRIECVAWLLSMMSNPAVVPLTNDELWAEARQKWPDKLSEREFHKCRADALAKLSEEQRYLWSRPGPKRKSPRF